MRKVALCPCLPSLAETPEEQALMQNAQRVYEHSKEERAREA